MTDGLTGPTLCKLCGQPLFKADYHKTKGRKLICLVKKKR